MFARRRSLLRRLSWIALLATLSLALLPTLGKAMAFGAGGGTGWAEVCTPQGVRLVALGDEAPAEPRGVAPAEAHLEHCALCFLSAQPPLLPPQPPACAPATGLSDEAPRLFLHAPRTLHAWRGASPRGPPLSA